MKFIKYLLLITLNVCNILFVNAQDVELKWGASVKNSRGTTPTSVLGKDETGVYILKALGDIFLEKFDNNMNLVWSKKLEIYFNKREKTIFETVLVTKNKIIVFTSRYDSRADTKQLFASYISKDGIIEPKLYEVNVFTNLVSKKSVDYGLAISDNGETILIFSNFREKNVEKEKFHYKVIDENFLQKSQSFVELPYAGLNTYIMDYIVDNAGNIHMVYSVNLRNEETGNKRNDDKIDFNYYILSYYPATKTFQEYDMRVGNYLIAEIKLIIDKESRFMYVPGFYADRSVNSLKGTIISKIDLLNKKIVYAKERPFDDAFLAVVFGKAIDDIDDREASKKKSNANTHLYSYDIRDIFVNENEELVMVSEQYYMHAVTTTSTTANGGTITRTTYYYYYNNVMVTKFGSDGDRVWSSNIPKYQVTTNDGGFYSSIGVFQYNDMVYIFYNDNPDNGTAITSRQLRTRNPQKSQLALISISTSGELKKSVLMRAPNKGKGIATRPKFATQVSDNQVILLGYLPGEYKIGKIDLK
jgi:hypothetical protein